MLLFATLCLLVGSSLGMKQMCCTPKSWEATFYDVKQKGPDMDVYLYAKDEDRLRDGFYLSTMGTDKPLVQVFNDYVTKNTYTVNMTSSDPNDYTCKQTINKGAFRKTCGSSDSMIKNVRYIGDATIGGSSGIVCDAWSFTKGNMEIVLTLSRGSCVPVFETYKSPDFDMLFIYDQVSPTVTHTELLRIPDACANTVGG